MFLAFALAYFVRLVLDFLPNDQVSPVRIPSDHTSWLTLYHLAHEAVGYSMGVGF